MTASQSGTATSIPSEVEEPRARYVLGVGFAVLLLATGILVLVQGLDYGFIGEDTLIGPGAAPVVLGVMLALGALAVLLSDVRGLLRKFSPGEQTDVDSDVNGGRLREVVSYARKSVLRPMFIVVLVGAGFGLSQLIGVIPSMSVTVVALATLVERLRIMPALIMGLIAAIVIWLIFVQLLSVRFPPSLLGI